MSYMSSEMDKIVDQLLSPMSNSDLNDLIALDKAQMDQKLEELIKDLPLIQKLEKEKELLITKNKSLAEFNLEKQPSYNEAHTRLVEVHEQALELQQQTLDMQKKLNANDRQSNAPDVLRGLLQVAAQEAEEESEALANKFTSGDCTYEQFLEEFVPIRSLSHSRRIKYEKLIEYIQRNPTRTASVPTSSSSLSSSADNHSSAPSFSNSVTSNVQPPYPPFSFNPYSNQSSGINPVLHHPVRSAPLPPYMSGGGSGSSALPPYPTGGHSFNTPLPVGSSGLGGPPPSSLPPLPPPPSSNNYPFSINPGYK